MIFNAFHRICVDFNGIPSNEKGVYGMPDENELEMFLELIWEQNECNQNGGDQSDSN